MAQNIIKDRVLIIGSNGMLGQRLVRFFSAKKVELRSASVEEAPFQENLDYVRVDITERDSVKRAIMDFCPDVIINSAAFTNVDLCETERELAWKINVKGVEYMADYASVIDAHVIHISSDYIFDGKNGPYTENDKPNPLGYYGRTKLASENALKIRGGLYTIIRPNVLYGQVKFGRPDFVRWVVSSLRAKSQIKIVDDQINNPTFIDDLVWAIDRAISYKKYGVYHIGGPEFLNRFEFAMRIADYFELDKSTVSCIKTEELNQAAKRPLKSGLQIQKARAELDFKPHTINDSFSKMKTELGL